ncbi:hypothetical protein ERX27_02470 [Macrococcus brunensis]|uniref:Uncharacterized protein n=1 Tax=Macrococcus brunensis TaxID=198483 RepID=A0A4R6BFS0_9STAP|nr:DUF6339 family protein [Macrococcus brunensis]TDL98660.1 hypothetical protein ERX27_02470 [Macrococcus brunensis]
MINWENNNYSVANAEKDFSKIEILTDEVNPINPPESMRELRNQMIEARDRIFEDLNLDGANKLGYEFDLKYGIAIYSLLNEAIGFTNRIAAKDDIWRYLSVNVIPDVVHARWGKHEDRYFRNSRRIWLKTIWWYVALSWHNNAEETYQLLKNNTTDTIMNLVERPGIGYHIELYREIMLQYNDHEDNDRNLFRSVLKLNTARLAVVTPELSEGGIKGYVNNLFATALGKE